ncbi:hypothetical protein ABVT39_014751 [Epinephelus coioides]
MAPSAAEVTGMRAKLRSIERLIEDLLQRQSELCSRLSYLEPAGNQRTLVADAAAKVPGLLSSLPSWSSVVKGNRRLSLPLYDPSGTGGGDDIPLTNFFSSLAELSSESVLSPIPPLERRVDRVGPANRKRSIAKNPTSPTDLLSPPSAPRRPCLSLQRLEPDNLPGSAAAPVTSSPPAQPPAAGLVPPAIQASNHPHSAEPGPAAPRSSPSQSTQRYLTHTHNRRHASTANRALAAYRAAQPKLAVYGHDVDSPDAQHGVLLLGDSMVRFVELPHTITYCFSGFKVADMIEQAPAIIDLHPSVHTVIVHLGMNE